MRDYQSVYKGSFMLLIVQVLNITMTIMLTIYQLTITLSCKYHHMAFTVKVFTAHTRGALKE